MLNNRPSLYIFFGLIASGKSTLAKAWASRHALACYNSDVVRKELACLAPEASAAASFGAGIYSPEFTARTYAALLAKAAAELEKGRSVVLDASYATSRHRQAAVNLAASQRAGIWFLLCTCPEAETRRRLELRAQDPTAVSDATWAIFQGQQQRFEWPAEVSENLLTIVTDQPPAALVRQLAQDLRRP